MRSALLLSLLSPVIAAAQGPVIEHANINLMGSSFAVHVVTDAGSGDLTTDGEDVVWDLSSATLQLNAGSTSFVDPADAPQGTSYPTSNLAQSVTMPSGTTYAYFTLGTAQLDLLAQGVGGADPDVFTDPKTPLVFPLAYGDAINDDYTLGGTAYSRTRTYTGYGTLILPTGTYTDVVKVVSSSGVIDLYRSNPVEFLLHMEDDGEMVAFSRIQAAVEEQGSGASLTAWPNPTTDQVRVAGLTSTGRWQLVDAQGRVQQQGNHPPGTLVLDLASLATGYYMLVAHDGSHTQRVMLGRH